MSNRRIKLFTEKLHKQFQFCAFVLILFLKLNHLSATPVIDRNKYGDLFVLKPPDVNRSDYDSLMHSGDKENSIANIVSARLESEIIARYKEKINHESSAVSEANVVISEAVTEESPSTTTTTTTKTTTTTTSHENLVDDYILQFSTNGDNSCMLDGLKVHMMQWAFENGSLAVPSPTRSGADISDYFMDASNRGNTTDEVLAAELDFDARRSARTVFAYSAAYNGLTYAPYKTLFKLQSTLQLLTLKGNNFSSYRPEADFMHNVLLRFHKKGPDEHFKGNDTFDEDEWKKVHGVAWATFPEMPQLRELDISNCMIEFISPFAFQNLTNLTVLYMSHNKMLKIPSEAFTNVPNLRYLDLSHLNALDVNFSVPLPSVEQIVNLLVGVKIEQHTFKELLQLEYLDLSYTKITRNSAVAFTYLGPKLRYMSLCFTAFPVVGSGMFKNTALRGLDLSGNSYAAYTMAEDSFSSVANTLEFLFFEQSNLKELEWLKRLKNLVVLNLYANNINTLSTSTFQTLTQLEVLDLSSNHIGNWYNRVFAYNSRLKILNLRDNNINILTSEMLIDFQGLDYLGIGDNNFVCDCVLKDFVDIATANNKKADCVKNVFNNSQALIFETMSAFEDSFANRENEFNIYFSGYIPTIKKYLPMITMSYQNVKKRMRQLKLFNLRMVTNFYKGFSSNACPNTNQIVIYDKINGSTLKFQLLDYKDEHYWCFNETEKMNFFELDCDARTFNDIITDEIRHVTKYVVIISTTVILLSVVILVVYLKRWQIHYYYSSLKTAALFAVAAENDEKFKELSESDSNLLYDLFISYCQSDREWVLEELMPNIEVAGDMSICMHERDFQVGLTILDNIISCMDRSRCLLLVISSNFLLSHWCQFEMRLAQHRMFEASKEHLILVFLEDIPKRKRPKTLQYLMEVKTYIKWPSSESPNAKWDEKKIFWKRLRKSLRNICWTVPQTT